MELNDAYYIAMLLFVTGGCNLVFDVKNYKADQLQTELKVARWLGWINVSFGGLVLAGNWVLERFFW